MFDWRQPSRPRSLLHHAVVAGLCALVSYLPLYALRESTIVGGASDAAVDLVMRSQDDPSRTKPDPPITLLYLDDETFDQLHRPLIFPRDRLALVLKRVAEAGPRLIVVDVDVSWPDTDDHQRALRNELSALTRAGSPPVFFIREALLASDSDTTHILPPSAFDDLIGLHTNLRFVSAQLVASPDGVVRRVQPW